MIRSAIPIVLAVAMTGAVAQTPPQRIHVADLIRGHVSIGTRVITRGHLAYINGHARMNPSLPSAMVPAIVDIAKLPPSLRVRIQTDCAAGSITSGGCAVEVQGQVEQIDARPGLVATEIDFL